MGTLERTWSLHKQNFNILSADAEIVFFPAMLSISAILLAAGFFYPLFRSGLFKSPDPQNIPWEICAILFIWFFLNYLVISFFNSALVGCANMRLSGGDPTMLNFLLFFPALLIGLLLFKADPPLAIVFGIRYIVILVAITSAVKGGFTAVLYRYASTGVLPTGFSACEIDSTFGERKRDPWDISV
jgi:hypothetical protein